MKITSRSIMTSIRLTTLISALRSMCSFARRRRMSDEPLADELGDHGRSETLHLQVKAVELVRKDVVPESRGNRDRQRCGGSDQGLGHARRDGREIRRALGRDSEESIDTAKYGAQQADERTPRADGRQPRNETAKAIALRRGFGVHQQ